MKKLITLLGIVTALILLSGCTSQTVVGVSPAEEMDDEILAPWLYINLLSESLPIQNVRAIQGVTNWEVCDEDGNCVGFLSDSAHSLQISQSGLAEVTLFLENETYKIELQFSQLPQSISVQRWNMEHWYAVRSDHDNMDRAMNEYEPVEIIETTIHLNNDGQNYIYEVHATWQEGFSLFTFRTESSQDEYIPRDGVPVTYRPDDTEKILQMPGSTRYAETSKDLDYTALLELLEINGFEFEAGNLYDRGVPTGRGSIYIGEERLLVALGFPLIQADPHAGPTIEITWAPEYMWPQRDSLVIVYSGDDSRIIDFLNEIFGERTWGR